MVNIVLFGAPGCGKGTQAQRLKEHYGIDHVSTGEVIRDEIRRGTELGQSMEAYIKAGQLAPDEIVIGMIDHYVTGHMNAAGCIFDFFHICCTFGLLIRLYSVRAKIRRTSVGCKTVRARMLLTLRKLMLGVRRNGT